MPSGAMPLIELLLYLLRNIFLYIVLLKRLINPQKKSRLCDTTQQAQTNPETESKRVNHATKKEKEVVKTNGDSDINGLLLHVGDHVGALDDDLLRRDGRCR